MQRLLQDFRYTLRQMRKSPGFAITALLTLALGMGATTVMFSLIENVLLRPLPYSHPQQLVVVQESIATPTHQDNDWAVNANHLVYWQRHSRSFSGIAALQPYVVAMGNGTEVNVVAATANLVSVLGFQPLRGRTFTSTEEQPGHDVVLLTEAMWEQHFGGDPNIVGSKVGLDGKQYEVVGVLPADFSLPVPGPRAEAIIPFGWTPDMLAEIEGDQNYLSIARLKPGVSIAQANAELNTLQQQISRMTPDHIQLSADLTPLHEYLVGSSRGTLLMLLAAVSFLLLIACMNVANLLLARVTAHAHAAAIRSALGATPGQMMRAALVEPVLLSLAGCAVGVTAAAVSLPLLMHVAPANLPRISGVGMDGYVVTFAVALSLVTAMASGLIPARRLAKSAPQATLRSESRTSTESKGAKRLGEILVAGEVMASVTLVLVAGLLVSSMLKLLAVDRGFQAQHVISAEVLLPGNEYGHDRNAPRRQEFYRQALERLRHLPGVRSAGLTSVLPLGGTGWGDFISRRGDTTPLFQRPLAQFRWISPGYFETMQIPLIAGRFISEADKGKQVAVISKDTADRLWPGQNPIGQRIRRGDPDEPPFEVIGVVGNVRALSLAEAAPIMVYVPYWYRSYVSAWAVVRADGDPLAMAESIRRVIRQIEPAAAVSHLRTMNEVVDGSVASRRFQMNLLLGFAVCSLLLASLGIYGMVSYRTSRRVHEIGLRMALGANQKSIYRMVVREGIAPVILGLFAGLALSVLAGRLVAGFLFEVHPADPAVAALACGLLLAVGVLACVLPARRAASIDPNQALREE